MTRRPTTPRLTHGVQLINTEWAPTVNAPSRAQREQATTTEWDLKALALARTRRAGIAWWWGFRVRDKQHHAYCYLCNSSIVVAHPDRPFNTAKRNAVLDHLRSHYPDLKD